MEIGAENKLGFHNGRTVLISALAEVVASRSVATQLYSTQIVNCPVSIKVC